MAYVYAGYGITVLVLAAYTLRLLARERSLRQPHRGGEAASAGAPATKR